MSKVLRAPFIRCSALLVALSLLAVAPPKPVCGGPFSTQTTRLFPIEKRRPEHWIALCGDLVWPSGQGETRQGKRVPEVRSPMSDVLCSLSADSLWTEEGRGVGVGQPFYRQGRFPEAAKLPAFRRDLSGSFNASGLQPAKPFSSAQEDQGLPARRLLGLQLPR